MILCARRPRHDAPRRRASPGWRRNADLEPPRRPRRRVLRASARLRSRDGVLRRRGEPDDALPLARVVLDRALRHVRDRLRPSRARSKPGLKYLDRRLVRLGRAALRLGARLRRDGQIGFAGIAAAVGAAGPLRRRAARARARADHRRARLQDVGGAVPHVDARRLRGRADAGDRVHVGGDEGRGARARDAPAADGVPAGGAPLDAGRSPGSRSHRSRSATSRRSCSAT